MKYGLAVAGTHGKTTTTSMLATPPQRRARSDHRHWWSPGLDGLVRPSGAGEFLVAEADESDGSFMLLDPTVAVITNIDPEHLEHWGSKDNLVDGFCAFANKVPFFGFATLCPTTPWSRACCPASDDERSPTASTRRQMCAARTWSGNAPESTCDERRAHGHHPPQHAGRHNVSNASPPSPLGSPSTYPLTGWPRRSMASPESSDASPSAAR